MIRIETEDDWLLLTHANHAALAGAFARHWKNRDFLPPEPFAHILDAVARHDDSWAERDALPLLTPEHNPSAFSKELVGTYDAFEEIDLEDYLGVRGQATEAAAARDPYAAILISMHTVNLLTEQADLSTLSAEDRAVHGAFIEGQRRRQSELMVLLKEQPDLAPYCTEAHFDRGFKFLQACDSFSLLVGVAFAEESQLRHPQVKRSGGEAKIRFHPQGDGRYVLDPWPLDEASVSFAIPYRRVPKAATATLEAFQAAYAAAADEPVTITVSAY
jgi:hypothetical protein